MLETLPFLAPAHAHMHIEEQKFGIAKSHRSLCDTTHILTF